MSSPSARPHSKSLFRGTILRRRLRMASREMPQKASLTRFISRPAMSPSCVFRAYNAPYNAFVSVWAPRLLMPFSVPLRAAKFYWSGKIFPSSRVFSCICNKWLKSAYREMIWEYGNFLKQNIYLFYYYITFFSVYLRNTSV